MEKILLDGSNWTSVINANLTEGAKLTFEDGFKCQVIEYYKAHHFKKGSKTALKIKVGSKIETIETDRLRAEHCPAYVQKTHAKPTKKFVCEGLEYGTDAELLKAREAITECLRKRDEERKAQKDKEIKSAINALQGLSKEEILNLLNK
jgi:hypothetical protein